ncbi:MAG: glycosyltransferase [Bacteroidota bacterium]
MSNNQQNSLDLVIVIPCYNEENRFREMKPEYVSFLNNHSKVVLCMVDDGSKDDTALVLQTFQKEFPQQIEVVIQPKNGGKAEAVRSGVLHCIEKLKPRHLAFLDADLATSFEECLRIHSYILEKDIITFAFASRILKIGSEIKRKKFRFVVGRIVATLISSILRIKVYDTQCGCKVFEKELATMLFKEKFISKWLFDVELFFRMIRLYGRKSATERMIEVPLKLWEDKGDSKVQMTYFFKLWIDLMKIKRKYNKG